MGNRREDGASAVEFALIFPLIAMLLFGMITAGLALNSQQQINHAAREGSRFAATLEGLPNEADRFDDVASRTRAAAVGQLNAPGSFICVLHVDGGTETGPFWYDATTNPPARIAAGNEPAFDCQDLLDGGDGERMQVGAFTPTRIEAILVRRDVTLSARSLSQYEPRPEPEEESTP